MTKTETIQLENGLTLLHISNKQNSLAYIQAFVKTGSIHEYPYLGSGLSHFLEHMIAGQATKSYSTKQINELLNHCGGMYNAYTTYDHTNYHINTQNETLFKALDIILEWLFFPAFEKKTFQQEKEVILREIEKSNSSVEQQFYEKAQQLFYQEQALSIPIIGYESLFKKITIDQLKTYYENTYTSNHILLCVTSSFSSDEIIEKIYQKKISPTPTIAPINRLFLPAKMSGIKTKSIIYQKTSHSRLSIRFKSVSINSLDRVIIDLLCHILSNGQESTLQKELIFKNQDCFEINMYHSSHCEGDNYIEIYADCKPEKIDTCYENCKNIFENLLQKGLSKTELKKAKNQKESEYYLLLENIEDLSNQQSLDTFYTQDPNFSQHYFKKSQTVTIKDIKRVLNTYFNFEHASVCISHPLENKKIKKNKKILPAKKISEEKIRLDNGLTLLLTQNKNQALTHINCMHLGGLYAETKQLNGISYLCADMLGKKSKNYNKKQLIGEFEFNGAQYFSASGQHFYHHNLICLSKKNQHLMPLFWDSILQAEFSDLALNESKDIQKQYINERENAWQSKGFYEFKKFFYKNHIYSNSLLGEIETLDKISVKHCDKFHHSLLNPEKMIVSIMGNYSEKDLNKTIETLSSLQRKKALNVHKNIKHDQSNEINCHTHLDIAAIFIGFSTTNYQDKQDNLYYTLINCILTGMSYPSGRLFNELREKGYVYQANGGHYPGINNGHMLFYALTNLNQIEATKACMLKHLNNLRKKEILDEEFEACKAQMKLYYKDQESKAHQSLITKAYHELMGLESKHNELMISRINSLSKKKIIDYCNKLQNPQILILKKD